MAPGSCVSVADMIGIWYKVPVENLLAAKWYNAVEKEEGRQYGRRVHMVEQQYSTGRAM